MFSPTPEQAESLGRALRAMRESVGLSARETARRIGVTHTTLLRFESGDRIIAAETLARLTRTVADEINRQRDAA